METTMEQKLPWHRQPLVWMLIFFPLSAIIGGIITIWLAIVSDDGLVADDYYWQGKQINRTLARDATARDYGLSAAIALQADDGLVKLDLNSLYSVNPPDALELEFLHTTRAGLDQKVLVSRRPDGSYAGAMPELAAGTWVVQLGTPQWRISGRVKVPGAGKLVLRPAK